MLSLILPYWARPDAADKSLRMLSAAYAGIDLEVIVVDDGTPEPYALPAGLDIDVRLIRLPTKSGPLNSCVPINRGVAEATGDFIALSGIEMLHERPILSAMRETIRAKGRDSYVSASVWNAERKRWHAHGSLKVWDQVCGVPMPTGAQFHFMTMMRRQLWDRADGFDEDYRDGAGYDDPDFVLRLAGVGARFMSRDDLSVVHPRTGARSAWTPEMFERNRQLFVSKWGGAARAAVANG